MFEWFRRLRAKGEEQRALYGPSSSIRQPDGWLLDVFGGYSATGQIVTPQTAENLAAVYACVQVISESIASLPLKMYRRRPDGGGRDVETNHPLASLLAGSPNRLQDSFGWRELMQSATLLRGVSYSEIISSAVDGSILELRPICPDLVIPVRLDDGSVVYDVAVPGGTRRRIAAGDMLAIYDRVDDPCVPRSRLNRAREAFGTALSGQTFAASIYRNSARPSGVLQTAGVLSAEGQQRLADSWKMIHGGAGKAGKTPVLENGVEWKPLGMTAEDAELLESRKFSVAEICRIFRVPPPVISDLEKATFANIVEQNRAFAVHCLSPWCSRWEAALERQLLTDRERNRFFFEFSLDGLMRGDLAGRFQSYAIGIQNGFLSPNEARRLENMNDRAGGDTFVTPSTPVAARKVGTITRNGDGSANFKVEDVA